MRKIRKRERRGGLFLHILRRWVQCTHAVAYLLPHLVGLGPRWACSSSSSKHSASASLNYGLATYHMSTLMKSTHFLPRKLLSSELRAWRWGDSPDSSLLWWVPAQPCKFPLALHFMYSLPSQLHALWPLCYSTRHGNSSLA